MDKKYDDFKQSLEKKFGKGSFTTLGERITNDVQAISTGSIKLDEATGIGGVPLGRVVEIFGWEGTAKTTLCNHIIANAQVKNLKCAFIDAEHAYHKGYAESIGVKTDELVFFQPSSGEEGLNYTEELLKSGIFSVIIVDSVAALIPQAELEGEIGDNRIGLQARMMSQAMRKLPALAAKSNCCLIFINQLREKIGVMFGDPSTTTAGNALKFFSSMRIKMTKSITNTNSIIVDDVKIGNLIKAEVIKNKVAAPFGQAEFYVLYGLGIDKRREFLTLALDKGVITKFGKSITYKGTKYEFTDKDSALVEFADMLDDNPEMYEEILKDCK